METMDDVKDDVKDAVTIRIDRQLATLPSSLPREPTILRIDDYFPDTCPRFSELRALSIGPFYHGRDRLKKMQEHKFRYLKHLLHMRRQSSVATYVTAMRLVEGRARMCYGGDLAEFDSDEFLEMMVLDGIFIVEFLRKFLYPYLREENDPIFRYTKNLINLEMDLIVLVQLFEMTRDDVIDWSSLLRLVKYFALHFFPWSMPHGVPITIPIDDSDSVDHLLGLVHRIWSSSLAKRGPAETEEEEALVIECATELQKDKGIEFRSDTSAAFGLDVRFAKGVMRFPPIRVQDDTEGIMRNWILYEASFVEGRPTYVTGYAYLLQCLIKTIKDVELLGRCGILISTIGGGDEALCRLFGGLCKNVCLCSDFYYPSLFREVIEYRENRMNRWMRTLRSDCLYRLLIVIVCLAAVLLVLLGLTQTVVGVLSYFRS